MTSPAPLQSIRINSVETRSSPTSHVVYGILVSLPVRSWTVWRRYSEFTALHEAFLSAGDGRAPPAMLPPKHAARNTIRGITTLGGWLGGSPKPGESSTAGAQDPILAERKDGLDVYLRAIISSPDPRWRETKAFANFIELPSNMDSGDVFRNSGSGGGGGVSSASAPGRIPGSYKPSPRPDAGARTAPAPLTTRKLGAAQETDKTRTLDDTHLLSSQSDAFAEQDAHLEGLTAALRRQRQMGIAINQELAEQAELLGELDKDVERTRDKMGKAEGQMKRMER